MNPEIKALKDTAENARMMYRLGAITREEAAERIKPYADAFNAKSKEIAKKYNQRPSRFSLAAYLR